MWVLLHIAKLHVRCYTKREQWLLFGSYKYIYKLVYFSAHLQWDTDHLSNGNVCGFQKRNINVHKLTVYL